MNIKTILSAFGITIASTIAASAATVLNTGDFSTSTALTSGNCPYGAPSCVILNNADTFELTYSGGVFDLTSFDYGLQGSGAQLTALASDGSTFTSTLMQGNNPDNTEVVNWTDILMVTFSHVGTGTVRIGGFSGSVPMAPVPVPASGLLLIGALGLGFTARRKSS